MVVDGSDVEVRVGGTVVEVKFDQDEVKKAHFDADSFYTPEGKVTHAFLIHASPEKPFASLWSEKKELRQFVVSLEKLLYFVIQKHASEISLNS